MLLAFIPIALPPFLRGTANWELLNAISRGASIVNVISKLVLIEGWGVPRMKRRSEVEMTAMQIFIDLSVYISKLYCFVLCMPAFANAWR